MINQKRSCVQQKHPKLSINRQCELLGLARSSYYHKPQEVDDFTLKLMNLIDEEYTRHPFFGTRRMRIYLKKMGHDVNRKRVQTLYQRMGIEAVYLKPNLSRKNKEHIIYPYLLREKVILKCNEVWSTDITY